MSEKLKSVKAAKTGFSYRNVKKDYTKFSKFDAITKNAHLELTQNNEAIIVEDRPDDWFELSQIGLDQVGLANIIDAVRRMGEDPYDGRFAFKDEEALDTSMIDPMNPQATKDILSSGDANYKKLEDIASQLGITVDELINHCVKGTLTEVIKASTEKAAESNEGGAE